MEVTPEFLDLAAVDHLTERLSGISGPAFLAPVATLEDLFVRYVAHALKMVDNPFVEVEAPVGERVGHCSSAFAVSRVGFVSEESSRSAL